MAERKILEFIDLFAGIGGFRLAFEGAKVKGVDCKCVFSSEWDVHSQRTYKENFGHTPAGDITKILTSDIPTHQILTGGFPCQPFSSIGKRQGFNHPTQGTLFFDVVRILKDHNTDAFLLENVAGLVNHDKGNTFKVIIETLEKELGYTVFYKVLNAAEYGVPQRRERLYIVGFSREVAKRKGFNFDWPSKSKEPVGIGDFVEEGVDGYSISRHLQKSYIYKVQDGRPSVITKKSDFPVKTLVASYHKIQRLTGTFVADGDTGLRLLSENECKAIMGFPKDFVFPVSRTQMYRQLGNAVAVPVVKKIAKSMVETLTR
jgi:DNA (cytosine-5)-methyltransferase 1